METNGDTRRGLTAGQAMALADAGYARLDWKRLGASDAYKAYRWNRELSKAAEAARKAQREAVEAALTAEELEACRKYEEALSRGEGPETSKEDYEAAMSKLRPLLEGALAEDAGMGAAAPLRWEAWHELRRAAGDALPDAFDALLEGILWAAPEGGPAEEDADADSNE